MNLFLRCRDHLLLRDQPGNLFGPPRAICRDHQKTNSDTIQDKFTGTTADFSKFDIFADLSFLRFVDLWFEVPICCEIEIFAILQIHHISLYKYRLKMLKVKFEKNVFHHFRPLVENLCICDYRTGFSRVCDWRHGTHKKFADIAEWAQEFAHFLICDWWTKKLRAHLWDTVSYGKQKSAGGDSVIWLFGTGKVRTFVLLCPAKVRNATLQ